jgi:hypothetical protein
VVDRELASQLAVPGSGELAYVFAYLAIVADLELDPIEDMFVDDLRAVLGISPDRAAELVTMATAMLTFGVRKSRASRKHAPRRGL